MQPRSILLSAIEKLARLCVRAHLNQVPGTRALYYLISELFWLWPTKSIREIEGSQMYLNPRVKGPMKVAFRSYIRSGGKEPLTTEIFKKVVKNGNVVLDIGANIGYFTLLAARLVGEGGKVYAFEPEPRNYEVLLTNVALNRYQNVTAAQKAVSDKNGVVRLYLSAKDIGAHTIRQHHDKWQFEVREAGEFVEVESVTLDTFFQDKKHPIDVIKMDMEGAEMAALLGMDRIIRENENLKMLIEFYPAAISEMGYSPEEFAGKLLLDYGFSITAIDELRAPTNQYVKINSAEELMGLCQDEEKIVNLFLER